MPGNNHCYNHDTLTSHPYQPQEYIAHFRGPYLRPARITNEYTRGSHQPPQTHGTALALRKLSIDNHWRCDRSVNRPTDNLFETSQNNKRVQEEVVNHRRRTVQRLCWGSCWLTTIDVVTAASIGSQTASPRWSRQLTPLTLQPQRQLARRWKIID